MKCTPHAGTPRAGASRRGTARRTGPGVRALALLSLLALALSCGLRGAAYRWAGGVEAVIGLDTPATLPAQRTPDHLRVLFIGNSFTSYHGGQARLVANLARATGVGRPPLFESVTRYGYNLQKHWRYSPALRRIREGNWDYVVLQDHSTAPLDFPDELAAYGRAFDAEARRAGARTLLFMTWARSDQPQMQATITAAYAALGRELGARVVPVGEAWREALARRPGLALHESIDHKHPTPAGSYLTACVFYATFYGPAADGAGGGGRGDAGGEGRGDAGARSLRWPSVPARVSADEANFLQRVASETVARWAADHPAERDGARVGAGPALERGTKPQSDERSAE